MSPTIDPQDPLTSFADCHDRILERIGALAELPALLEPAARARRIAAESIAFFGDTIALHHEEEERELFPAVLADARPGEEFERVSTMVRRLSSEHRAVENGWLRLAKGLKQVAQGRDSDLDAAALRQMLALYAAHARYEEAEFLPLCEQILGRNRRHLAALGLSLHLRHAKPRATYL